MWPDAAIGFLSGGAGPGRPGGAPRCFAHALLASAAAGVLRLVGAQMRARWAGAAWAGNADRTARPGDAATPVPPRACHASRSRRGGPPGRAAGPARAKSMDA